MCVSLIPHPPIFGKYLWQFRHWLLENSASDIELGSVSGVIGRVRHGFASGSAFTL
ncbi:hypothetical protein BT69DRAFT_1290935, partial [Atractiella rhizophila]